MITHFSKICGNNRGIKIIMLLNSAKNPKIEKIINHNLKINLDRYLLVLLTTILYILLMF